MSTTTATRERIDQLLAGSDQLIVVIGVNHDRERAVGTKIFWQLEHESGNVPRVGTVGVSGAVEHDLAADNTESVDRGDLGVILLAKESGRYAEQQSEEQSG